MTTRRATTSFTADAGEVAPGPVAYSPDGTTLATGDRAGTIRLWKLSRTTGR